MRRPGAGSFSHGQPISGCLQTPAYRPDDGYDRVRLIVRNPGKEPITLPLAAETTAAASQPEPDARFLAVTAGSAGVTTVPLPLLISSPDATTTIMPGREYRCEMRVEMRVDSLGFPTDTGLFRWVLHGVGTSNATWLYNGTRGGYDDIQEEDRPPLWFRIRNLWTFKSR